MNPSNRDPAAIAAAFERADAIVALAGFVPDDGYKAIQRRVVEGELTSDQAVRLVIAQARAADRVLVSGPAEARTLYVKGRASRLIAASTNWRHKRPARSRRETRSRA
jgi:hypothetical protein